MIALNPSLTTITTITPTTSSPLSPTTSTTTSSTITSTTTLSIPNCKFAYDATDGRIISFSCVRSSNSPSPSPSPGNSHSDGCSIRSGHSTVEDYYNALNNNNHNHLDVEEDDERLASLEALRYALHHAPFAKQGHTLMSIPDECSLAMQGIPTKCAIRADGLSYRTILEDVNMEVPKGKIYALLGCSGSGKSTLLKLILGRLRPTSGSVTTFATSPSKRPLSAICVGYMPQAVALAEELTVGQTLRHYGRLYQLPAYLIEERVTALRGMLHLPPEEVKVRSANQGQKWRLSLAVALIHSPPLLLLDEPTVMVDPLIRWSVWNRLERLCEEEGLTVLITTQYPEEIGFAYKAGLMRDGTIVAEDRPEDLRNRYGCDTYDALYQKICERKELIRHNRLSSIAPYLDQSCFTSTSEGQNNQNNKNQAVNNMFPILERLKPPDLVVVDEKSYKNSYSHYSFSGDTSGSGASSFHSNNPRNWLTLPMAEWPICERRRTAYISRFINLDVKRLFALVLKNLLTLRGNAPIIAVFYFLFPALQIVFMCTIFGRTVRHLPVAVPADLVLADNFGPTFVHGFLDERIFAPSYVANLPEALEAVVKGRAVAAVVPWTTKKVSTTSGSYSSQNGSSQVPSTSSQQQNPSYLKCNSTLEDEEQQPTPFGVKLYLDQSNYIITQTMFYSFLNSMRHFVRSDASRLIGEAIWRHHCPQSSSSPSTIFSPWWNHSAVEVTEVLYGSTRFRFLEFLLPGFLCAIVFSYALVLSAYLFIKEHIGGLQERCLATGTSGIELLASHYISQTALYVVQEALILLIVFRLFGLPSQGPLYALWLLVFLQGLTGISFGLFIAVICPKPIAAAMITSALFIPAFFFSGIIWPIESMHRLAQHLSHALPLTLPINSLRYILSRGPDMRYGQILLGFSISSGYIVALLLFTVAIFKCKTSS